MTLRATVIIPVYQQWSLLAQCLEALEGQTVDQAGIEILIVNNDPEVAPPAALRLPPNARIIEEHRKGSYAARNAGLQQARGDILCFTDADCAPQPNWLETVLTRLEHMSPPARVGGPIRLTFGHDNLNAAETYQKFTSFDQRQNIEVNGWSVTANMCTHAAAFAQVGPFDDTRMSGGDKEWGLRAQAAGIPIAFSAEAVVAHPGRASMAELIRKERRLTGGKLVEKIRTRNLRRMQIVYLLTFPFRLLPVSSGLRKMLRRPDASLGDRLRMAWVYYVLKQTRLLETGRLLILGRDPERR